MNRRSFLKVIGGLSASIALPIEAVQRALPAAYSISPVRWMKAYDLGRDSWMFRATVFVGKKVDETTDHITLESPVQWDVVVESPTKELNESSKQAAVEVLLTRAERSRKELQV